MVHHLLTLFFLAVCVLGVGCSVISPPPMMMQMGGPTPGEVGDVRLMVTFGVAGGVFVDGGAGVELRAETQLNDTTALGFGLGGGLNLEHNPPDADDPPDSHNNHPRWLWGLRSWGKFNPGDLDWLALTAGAGFSGTSEGLVALTLDASSVFGYRFAFTDTGDDQGELGFSPYGGPALGLSVPLRAGAPIIEQEVTPGLGPDVKTTSSRREVFPSFTSFLGFHLGTALDSKPLPSAVTAFELLYLQAFSQTDDAALFTLALGQGAKWRP